MRVSALLLEGVGSLKQALGLHTEPGLDILCACLVNTFATRRKKKIMDCIRQVMFNMFFFFFFIGTN